MEYASFITAKSQFSTKCGFDPLWMPDFLFDFQTSLVEWALQKGRAAIFADCGMGKTIQQLVWAENIVRKTNRPVLILTPLAVGQQTVMEADRFGIESVRSNDGTVPSGKKIIVTNYEKLHKFNSADFAGCVCDESSILKNFNGKRKEEVTEFMRAMPYRLLCTATAAPNDYVELGTSAEALGEMGFQDMVTRFFRKETSKDHLGWGRTKYQLRTHAEKDFWRWVCSWSRAIRKPSDLGFSDDQFKVPPLTANEHVITAHAPKPGVLFDTPAITLEDQREERRRTIGERCEKAASLADHKRPVVAWCHLNDEGDLLQKLIPGSVQVSGVDSDEFKEETYLAFASGQIRALVTKPELAGFGLNWQHCSHQTFFPSHSFERYYQAVRRSWRFGQKRKVVVDMVTSEGEAGVMANLKRKQIQADAMFDQLVENMNNQLRIEHKERFKTKTEIPSWLSTNKS